MSVLLRIARLASAAIFLQSLFFKFTAHPESIMIFSSLGLEPRGRIGIGVIELIAALLLLFGGKKSRMGGAIGGIVMLGALYAHLTALGVNMLFFMAIIALLGCLVVVWIQRQEMLHTIRQRRFRGQLIITIILLLTYLINYLATTDALGISMMQLGSIFPFPYMPPGWTFGIARGVIYLLLAVFVFVGRTQKGRESKLYQGLLPWLVITCILNMLRLRLTGAAAYAFSVAVIFILRVVLSNMVSIITRAPTKSSREQWTVKLPRGIYYGRISLAAGMIALSQLIYLNAPLVPVTKERTVLIVIVGILITGISFRKRRNRGQLAISTIAFVGIVSVLFTHF